MGILAFVGLVALTVLQKFEEQRIMEEVEVEAEAMMDDIHQQVILDSIEQYRIASEHGSHVDAQVHAGLVAEAFLQAHDEVNYRKWCELRDKHEQLAHRELLRSISR